MTYPHCPNCETLRESLAEAEDHVDRLRDEGFANIEAQRDLNARIHTLEGLLLDLHEMLGPSRFADECQRIEDVLGLTPKC